MSVTHRQVNGGTELRVQHHEQNAEESGSERARAKAPLVLEQEFSFSKAVQTANLDRAHPLAWVRERHRDVRCMAVLAPEPVRRKRVAHDHFHNGATRKQTNNVNEIVPLTQTVPVFIQHRPVPLSAIRAHSRAQIGET